MPVKNVGDIFGHLFWMALLLVLLAFGGQVVNAAGVLPEPIELQLVTTSFTLLFGALLGILDPNMIIKRLAGNDKSKEG